ncbi:hypothetical protein EJB05_27553 [Eragrostis curvula]|uniref:Uncharacterized protein n=1 Tax=Eragrostis curvula TaxID=38414 RepID=A0A5J9UNS8_9POAL|nr:hypothetical protein EJB05_27553 [Eragrostis curvula]
MPQTGSPAMWICGGSWGTKNTRPHRTRGVRRDGSVLLVPLHQHEGDQTGVRLRGLSVVISGHGAPCVAVDCSGRGAPKLQRIAAKEQDSKVFFI